MAEDGPKVVPGKPTTTPSVIPNISPARLYVVIAGIWLCLFMSAIDTTIITTALIKISSDFNALSQAPWLITAYLLTYNSFLMITAKLSDVWGVKTIIIACNILFLVFSMACGGAKTMTQLIIFRAFQGIGGSGLYSLAFVSIMKLIVPEKLGFFSGVISSVFALANLLGPLLGGVITDRTSWRWIFWINGPIVAISTVLLFLSMPMLKDGKSNRDRLRGFDSVGGIFSICWPIPLLFALQEAGHHYSWDSGVIIGTLVAGLAAFFLFGLYEARVSYKTEKHPIFPMRFLSNPAMALLLLSMCLIGVPFYTVFIQLPQRFQYVNFTSAERAGILLLPVTLLTPAGAMVGPLLASKVPIEFVLLSATGIISIGMGLLSSLPVEQPISNLTYGYEIITGFGLGLSGAPYYMLLAASVEEKDVSIGTGALNMFRTLGGAIAVAICSALHHSELQKRLPDFLEPDQIEAITESNAFVKRLPPEIQKDLGRVFGRSYNRQFQVMLAFTCFNFLVVAALCLVRKRMGIFGTLPTKHEENEFMKTDEKKEGDIEEGKKGPDAKDDIPIEELTSNREVALSDEISQSTLGQTKV